MCGDYRNFRSNRFDKNFVKANKLQRVDFTKYFLVDGCGKTRNSLPLKFFSSNQFSVRFFSKNVNFTEFLSLPNLNILLSHDFFVKTMNFIQIEIDY